MWTCAGGEVVELLRAQAELASVVEATGLALVREADVRSLAADAGQPSTRTWLAQLLRITPGLAGARIADAEVAGRKAREVGAALAKGRVNTQQARETAPRRPPQPRPRPMIERWSDPLNPGRSGCRR